MTGVQTCALPISSKAKLSVAQKRKRAGYLTDYLLKVLDGASAAG